MARTAIKKTILATFLLALASGMLCAQEIAPDTSINIFAPNDSAQAAQASDIIFNNVEPRPNSYDTSSFNAYSVAGLRAQDTTEEWVGVAFIPKVNVRAKGSTTDIPDSGTCSQLPQPLVASPDNVNAPSFEGLWQTSNLDFAAYTLPELGTNWTTISGSWLAAKILGTTP